MCPNLLRPSLGYARSSLLAPFPLMLNGWVRWLGILGKLFYHSASLFLSLVAVKSMTCEIHDLSKTSPGHGFHKSCISQVMDFTRKHMYFTSHEVMYFTKFSPFHPLVFPDLKRCRRQEGSRRRAKGTKVEDHGWVSVAVCFWNSRLEV